MSFLSQNEIISSFPFPFRGNQEDAIKRIAEAINKDHVKYVIIQAPTGAGKSPLAIALAKASKDAYILTAKKILQDQYIRDFNANLDDLRGRSNYRCLKSPGFTCAGAPCRTSAQGRAKCNEERGCEYHFALDGTKTGKIASMNFAASIAFFSYTPFFKERQILLVDEAHLIADNLTNFIELNVSREQLERVMPNGQTAISTIPLFEESKDYLMWLSAVLALTQEREKGNFTSSLESKLGGKQVTFEEVETFNRKLKTIMEELRNDSTNLIVDHIFNDFAKTVVDKISFKPIDVSAHAHNRLFKFGQKVVLMSATIIHYKEFIKSLGIAESEAEFIDIESTFPKENRPIIRNFVGTLNYGNLQASLPRIVQSCAETLRNHKDEKGIIHTHTYAIAKRLSDDLRQEFGNRILFPENSNKQAEILTAHTASKNPTVLISPSMSEGVDLKDDLSRFQVIVKVPYPYIGDKVVKARMAKSPDWYAFRTLLTIIQAYGRSTRSPEDHSVTYILDGAFDSLISRNRKILPKWFVEAII